jgi:hypothetical protein
MKNKTLLLALIITGVVLVFVVAFYLRANAPNSPVSPLGTATPTSVWNGLLQSTPFAYFTPLPEPTPSVIDGVYTKLDSSHPQWWKCLRCADYRVAGGIWRLQLEQGVLRVYYEVTGWRSIASYKVEGDRLYVFNDPYCPEHTGEYQWSVENGNLNLKTINDPCSFNLRAENFSKQAWVSCNSGVALGCEDKINFETNLIPDDLTVEVKVYGGDSRFFNKPPDVIAHANADDMPPPAGVEISFAPEAIDYGLHRVLWWDDEGRWIEAQIDDSFNAVGVQILGEQTIGWARVLFDGEEVWRGNTAGIWSRLGRHGGFIEISGFEAGEHVIRVEALGFDYRPVVVASFGLSRSGGVIP